MGPIFLISTVSCKVNIVVTCTAISLSLFSIRNCAINRLDSETYIAGGIALRAQAPTKCI